MQFPGGRQAPAALPQRLPQLPELLLQLPHLLLHPRAPGVPRAEPPGLSPQRPHLLLPQRRLRLQQLRGFGGSGSPGGAPKICTPKPEPQNLNPET